MKFYLESKREGKTGIVLRHTLRDEEGNAIVTCTDDGHMNWDMSDSGGNHYDFGYFAWSKEKTPRKYINTPYPLEVYKFPFKKLNERHGCTHFKRNGETLFTYSRDAMRVRPKGRFTAIWIDEFTTDKEEYYYAIKVGPRKTASHYYCIFDNCGRTVAVVERYPATKKSKATIHLQDLRYFDVALAELTFMCITNESNRLSNEPGENHDPEAPNYYSMMEEELVFLDKTFLSGC